MEMLLGTMDKLFSTTFDDDLDERSMSRRLRTATRPQSNFSRKIVRDAFSRLATLMEINNQEHKS